MDKEARRMQLHPSRAEELGLGQEQRCLPTDVDGNARMDLVDEPVVVEVGMGDDHPGQRRVGPVDQTGNRRKGDKVFPSSPQGLSHIEDDPTALIFEFDAVPADLMSPSMDTNIQPTARR